MMGPLHTEMAFMSTLGDNLKDSGWKTITSNAQIAQPVVAESLVSGHDVVRTKYVHQLTASSFNIKHTWTVEQTCSSVSGVQR